MAKQEKNSMIYVCWGTGLGKTSCMMEMGHSIGLSTLAPKSKNSVDVKLVLANADLLPHY